MGRRLEKIRQKCKRAGKNRNVTARNATCTSAPCRGFCVARPHGHQPPEPEHRATEKENQRAVVRRPLPEHERTDAQKRHPGEEIQKEVDQHRHAPEGVFEAHRDLAFLAVARYGVNHRLAGSYLRFASFSFSRAPLIATTRVVHHTGASPAERIHALHAEGRSRGSVDDQPRGRILVHRLPKFPKTRAAQIRTAADSSAICFVRGFMPSNPEPL